jgi:hypothetical protein
VDGSFAYISRDGEGLRQASLVSGRELRLTELTIQPAAVSHQAAVTALDYLNNIATLDCALPSLLTGRFFEVGTPAKEARRARWSNFQASKIEGNTLVWRKGADGGTGILESIRPMTGVMTDANQERHWKTQGATEADVLLNLRMGTGLPDGRNNQVALSKTAAGETISATVVGQTIIANASDVTRLGLAPNDRIRLYEIALGDTFQTSTQVSVSRHDNNVYRIDADIPCTISVRAAQAWSSTDNGSTWQPLPVAADHASHREWTIPAEQIEAGGLQLRWQ